MRYITIFPIDSIVFNINALIVDKNTDLWAWMGGNCQKIVVLPKMSIIFSKIVRKQRLHACDFFHVCPRAAFASRIVCKVMIL